MKGRTQPGAGGNVGITRTAAIDVTDARRRYRAEFEAALACAGGKTRKRTFTRMVHAVTEHRGAELVDCPTRRSSSGRTCTWATRTSSSTRTGRSSTSRIRTPRLWKAWERIDPDALVLVVVGDVAMGEAVCDATWERVRAAPGRHKHLIIGNHDVTGPGEVRTQGFDDVWSVMVSAGAPPLVWTHYPLAEVPGGHVNVHGHRHGAAPRTLAAHQRGGRAARLRAGTPRPAAAARAGARRRPLPAGREHHRADRTPRAGREHENPGGLRTLSRRGGGERGAHRTHRGQSSRHTSSTAAHLTTFPSGNQPQEPERGPFAAGPGIRTCTQY